MAAVQEQAKRVVPRVPLADASVTEWQCSYMNVEICSKRHVLFFRLWLGDGGVVWDVVHLYQGFQAVCCGADDGMEFAAHLCELIARVGGGDVRTLVGHSQYNLLTCGMWQTWQIGGISA